MRSLLEVIDVKGSQLLLLERSQKGEERAMMIKRIHFMVLGDQLNLQKLKDFFINLNLKNKVPLNKKGNDKR